MKRFGVRRYGLGFGAGCRVQSLGWAEGSEL